MYFCYTIKTAPHPYQDKTLLLYFDNPLIFKSWIVCFIHFLFNELTLVCQHHTVVCKFTTTNLFELTKQV